ncbi:RDD family protein [Aestuariimicrobium sp. T2.26MG-19.2B]|uniref:RDD family protein n=1 Tax=Aestuariimicrobium sp. T2.26MG-19.2B TaxID=3040679 RepID=UPI00247735EE|nr:RDD family protein [Aestuariimicrobium sp. T2.26MG-19.2B]CAI9401627.1 hypothetical protein AESSP_00630 [Aestuariimicrobium sp. T2.26MG-19.2B]
MAANMPAGVQVASLGRRLVAHVIDSLVPAVLVAGFVLLRPHLDSATLLVASLLFGIAGLGWFLVLWWSYGTRATGPGFAATGLRLVGLQDGRPIGWGRWLVRQIVFSAISGTGVGWIALLVFLVIQERRQGWHDLASGAVVIQLANDQVKPQARPAAPVRQRPTTVALPPHLVAAAFDGSGSGQAGSYGPPSNQEYNAYGQQAPMGQQVASAPPDQTPWAAGGHETDSGGGWRPPAGPVPRQAGAAPQTASPGSSIWPPSTRDPEPERAARVVQREAPVDEEDYGTRLIPTRANLPARPADEGWYVQIDDGRRVPVEGTVVIGRRPSQPTDGPTATLVEVGEGGQAVSKTHLAVGVDARGVYVTDLGSTNGTALVNGSGELDPCQPGVAVRVREGQSVSFGDRALVVMRHPPASATQ